MGCIRVLNEIVRDIDDLLMGVENTRSDVRWAAIQKIKTVGPCYMAASGLDPVTEEQTRQVFICFLCLFSCTEISS